MLEHAPSLSDGEVERITDALDALDIVISDDTIEQMAVCARAMRIYVEREAQYGSNWKQFNADDSAHHVVHKASRMRATASMADLSPGDPGFEVTNWAEAGVDSALDAIIYAGFFVRHVEGNAA